VKSDAATFGIPLLFAFNWCSFFMTQSVSQVALITGAGSGIGKATALAFAKAGINLVLLGRSRPKLEAVAQAAQSQGVQATVHQLDLFNVEQVREQVAAIVATLPRLDILVNNAGMAYTGTLAEMPLADWQQVMNLNLTSVFLIIQAALPKMRQQNRGTIVNLSSIAGHQAFPQWGAYCVSKFGLMALTKTLAAEERANGIRVLSISPGSVNTPLWDTDTVQADFDRAAMLTPEIVAESILHAVLMPSSAVIEDLILMPNAGTF
jgi:NADP-dependent 3-hydroxy acid dehydrogenase YdfG